MSQHIFVTEDKSGRMIQIQMGWDKPLQRYYCIVEAVDAEDSDNILYSNLDETETVDPTLDYYLINILSERFGVEPPDPLMKQVKIDAINNVVNRVEHYPMSMSLRREKILRGIICLGVSLDIAKVVSMRDDIERIEKCLHAIEDMKAYLDERSVEEDPLEIGYAPLINAIKEHIISN
ncbi:MAG: hypothetical protein V3W04_06605 [Gammaproteobacteria bacterium]